MSHTSRTRRRISILLTIALGCATAVGGVYAWRKHRLHVQTAAWRQEGLAASKRGDYSQVIDKLTLYLARIPEDREALESYIDARPRVELPNHQHWVEQARAIKYLLHLDPNLLQPRLKLLNLYRQLGLRSESIETADVILKQQPANSQALETKVNVLIDLKKYAPALLAARDWCAAEPLNPVARLKACSLMAQTGQSLEQILADIDAWHRERPSEEARFNLFSAFAYGVTGDRASALARLRLAAKQPAPDDAFAQILIAQIAAEGDPGEDVAVLRTAVATGAGSDIRQMLLSRLWEQNQWKEVVEVAQKLDMSQPTTSTDILALVCLADISLNDTAGANGVRRILAGRNDPIAQAWCAVLGPSSSEAAGNLALAGQCRRALEVQPNNPYLLYFLGEALARLNENDLAIEAWQQASDIDLTWGLPLSRLADLLLQSGDVDRAAQAATAAFRRGATVAAAVTLTRAAVAEAQTPNAISSEALKRLIDELDKAIPGNQELSLLRAQFLAITGEKQQAIEVVKKLLESPSLDEPSMLRLVAISEAGSLGLEASILDTDERLHGVTPNLALRRALAKSPSDGLIAFDTAMAGSSGNKVDWALARVTYLDRTRADAAKAQWQQLCEQQPQNLAIQQAALNSRAMRGDRAFGEHTIQRLQKILGPMSLTCMMARARLISATRANDEDDRELAQLLAQIVGAHPGLTAPRLLRAQSLERAGKINEAIDQLQLAQSVGANSTGVALSLASLYRQKGDDERARQELDRISAQVIRNPVEARFAARLLSEEGDYAKAAAIVEPISRLSTSDGLLLADLYWRQNRFADATQLVERLLQAPDADTIEFAARLYISQGKTAESEHVLALLDNMKLASGRAELVKATCLASVGSVDQAIAQYHSAIDAAPHDTTARRCLIGYLFILGRTSDASAVVEEGLRLNQGDQIQTEIKRATPMLSAIAAYAELHPLLIDYLKNPAQSARSLAEMKQIFDASQLNDDPSEQVARVTVIAQRYPRAESVQRWAIRMYLRNGQPMVAARGIERALATFPQSPEVAALAYQFYAGEAQWDKALDAAHRWRDRITDPIRADVAIASALIELKNPSQAVTQLQPHLAQARSAPDHFMELLFTDAEALCVMGDTASAELLIFPHAKEQAAWRAAGLKLAARKLSDQDAQRWISQVASMIDRNSIDETTLLAEAWAAVGMRHAELSACLNEAKRTFASVEARHDASAGALEQAGIFAEQTGDTNKAKVLYLRSVQLDPNRPIAQNNLAMLLSADDGNLPEALGHAKAALSVSPRAPELLDTFAYISAKAGDYKAAAAHLRRAIALDAHNIRWSLNLADILFKGGEKDEAAKVLASIDTGEEDLTHLPPSQQNQLVALRQRIAPIAATSELQTR
ncbi:MAG TPA: tetratricopeptide repeat protein [Humisphaera sp.]|nr:tetratricopeptide repeat protein [Humisphaera sp.]